MERLDDHVAIVTGASRGIGRAVALELARRGARVAALARTRQHVEDLAREIQASGGSAIGVACDMAQLESVEAAYESVTQQIGAADLLINNAGVIGPLAPTAEVDPRAWADTIAINLIGTLYATRLVLPQMIARGHGRIVNVSSGAAQGTGIVRASAYSSSKAGMDMLTRTLAAELGDGDISVVSVYPGVVDTAMQGEMRATPPERFGAETSARFHRFYEQGELLDPSLPARLIAALCGTIGPRYNGQIVRISDSEVADLVAS